MLKVYFGDMNKVTMNDVNLAFNLRFKAEWFQNELVRRIISDIDYVEDVKGTCLFVRGMHKTISPQELAGGTKSLILMLMCNTPKTVFYSGFMGENCYPYVFEIARNTDINLVACSRFPFTEGETVYIYDTDKYVKSQYEFNEEYFDACERWNAEHYDEDGDWIDD